MESKRVTIAQVKARAKELGIRAKWSSDWQEWEVNGGFMTDHTEALSTLDWLADHPEQITA